MELIVPVTSPSRNELASSEPETSAAIRARIVAARERQRERLFDTHWTSNAEIPTSSQAILELCRMTPAAESRLLELAGQQSLSMREVHRIRRVARTIADLDSTADADGMIDVDAITLAAQLRQLPHPPLIS